MDCRAPTPRTDHPHLTTSPRLHHTPPRHWRSPGTGGAQCKGTVERPQWALRPPHGRRGGQGSRASGSRRGKCRAQGQGSKTGHRSGTEERDTAQGQGSRKTGHRSRRLLKENVSKETTQAPRTTGPSSAWSKDHSRSKESVGESPGRERDRDRLDRGAGPGEDRGEGGSLGERAGDSPAGWAAGRVAGSETGR